MAGIQNADYPPGWSADAQCRLTHPQQLWLDRDRTEEDAEFRQNREQDDWKQQIALEFAVWLNHQLEHKNLTFGVTEQREWKALFRRRLREFEDEDTEGQP